ELWVELKRMYEPDPKDQLWTLTQNYMHAPVEWKLYDLGQTGSKSWRIKKMLLSYSLEMMLQSKGSINEGEVAAKRISNDSEEVARVLTSMDAATILARGIDVPTGSGSIPTAGPHATIISTGSEVGPTASLIVTRRKGKEVMVESDTPKKKKLQEQIDAQVARELEEKQEKENMRMNEQIARDTEVARIHAKEEL
nr:hypothetical protein [Tanacetum cinerariifolium]